MNEIETLKQEFDILQTTFLPKEELEDMAVTTNIDEWIEFIENCKTDPLAPSEYICDYTIVKNAKAFALAPVFSYMGKVEACSASNYNSLKDLKDYLKNKKYLLYYIIASVKAAELDKESFTLKPLDAPELKYTFRGHILD